MLPLEVILRITWFPESLIYKFPLSSRAIPSGYLSCAGPPEAEIPAHVEKTYAPAGTDPSSEFCASPVPTHQADNLSNRKVNLDRPQQERKQLKFNR